MSNVVVIDCNNFFVSCERVFNPKLEGKPVVVLSGNDGCVVSRSNEAKALGIPMGAPAFKWENVFRKYGVKTFSSNFTLYSDMSRRVSMAVKDFAEHVEQYSVDELFIDIEKDKDYREWAHKLRKRVLQWTGIPTSIGIASTKTLAKIANRIAKKQAQWNGVVDWNYDIPNHDAALAEVDISDIWGIGRSSTRFLRARHIDNALQLRSMDDDFIRNHLTVMGLRTVYELRGTSCISLVSLQAERKSVTHSRSFGRMVTERDELQQAISLYASLAAHKLRRLGLVASDITVYIRSNRFREDLPQYANSVKVGILPQSNYTASVLESADNAFTMIYKEGYHYAKAGVVLTGLCPAKTRQHSLFSVTQATEEDNLMKALDKINNKYGRNTLYPAACGVQRTWKSRSAKKSSEFSTSLSEIPICYAR